MTNDTPHARLVVLMCADMVGYSRIMDQDEARAIRAIRELRETYLEPVAAHHGGQILKRMGDGWIVAFDAPDNQVRCAMEVQSALAGHGVIRLRIGAHVGEIFEDEHDFYGAGVNLAQRLQTEAPPGGLMVSGALLGRLAKELRECFRDAGMFWLKNISEPVDGFQWRPARGSEADSTTGRRGADDVPVIAVESFGFAPDESDPESIAADLHDQLVTRLSRRTGVRVVDAGSTGDRAAVYVLQGRLRIARVRGRLSLKFVLPGEGRTVWTQIYEGDTTDVFAFTDDLVERAESDLRLQINAFDGERIANLPDDVLSISELRSRAASAFYGCTVGSYERAGRLMDKALQLNPTDPMALAMRAEAKVIVAAARHTSFTAQRLRVLEADLNEAVEALPRSDYVFSMRALFRCCGPRDASGAVADAERALSLSPAYATAHEMLGLAKMLSGDYDAAANALGRASALSEADPFLPSRLFELAVARHLLGQQREAINDVDRAIQLGPRQRCFHLLRAICCREAGDHDAAAASDAMCDRLAPEPSVLAIRLPLPDAHRGFADRFAPL